jgi:hypothetical protein
MSPDSNEVIDTLDNKVAAIATVADNTARRDPSAIPAYFMYALETVLCWREEVLGADKPIQDYTCLPFWNRAIAGLPGTFLISLTQLGLSDKLTIQLALLKYLERTNKKLYTDLLKISPCYEVVYLDTDFSS